MLESKYCGHCRETLPLFEEACEEQGVIPEILDLSVKEDQERMYSLGIQVQYTPTFIFGCNYYVGVKTKEKYLNYINQIEVN